MTNTVSCGICQAEGREAVMAPVPGLAGIYRHVYIDESNRRITHEMAVDVEIARYRVPPRSLHQVRQRERNAPNHCPYCGLLLKSDDRGPLCPPNERHGHTYRPGERPAWMPLWGRMGGKQKGGGGKSGRKRKKPKKRRREGWET